MTAAREGQRQLVVRKDKGGGQWGRAGVIILVTGLVVCSMLTCWIQGDSWKFARDILSSQMYTSYNLTKKLI
jgi:hypothetical protein